MVAREVKQPTASPVSLARHRTPAPGGASYSDAVVVEAGGARWIYVAGQTPRPDSRPATRCPPTWPDRPNAALTRSSGSWPGTAPLWPTWSS